MTGVAWQQAYLRLTGRLYKQYFTAASTTTTTLKWTLCSSREEIETQNFNTYNINEDIIQLKFLFASFCFFFSPCLSKQALLRGK